MSKCTLVCSNTLVCSSLASLHFIASTDSNLLCSWTKRESLLVQLHRPVFNIVIRLGLRHAFLYSRHKSSMLPRPIAGGPGPLRTSLSCSCGCLQRIYCLGWNHHQVYWIFPYPTHSAAVHLRLLCSMRIYPCYILCRGVI